MRKSSQASQSPIRLGTRLGKVLLAAAVAGTVLMGCGTPQDGELIDEPPGGTPPATDTQPEPSPPADTQPEPSPPTETPPTSPGGSDGEEQQPDSGGTTVPGGDQESTDGSTETSP